MSELIIREVKTRKEMVDFVRFNYTLYKDNAYAVPDLLEDTLDIFDPRKNPAYNFCETACFLAYRDQQIVGRIAAIINRRTNERWGMRDVRFGWIDFIDDREVSARLIETAAAWGKERGMNRIVGPLGFTDMDLEGMLVEGFDQLSTMNSIYNYPYYPQHMQALGFTEDARWEEHKVFVPREGHEATMDKYFKVAEVVKRRYGFRLRKFKDKKEISEGGYIQKILGIINRAYANLYGYCEMDDQQMETYAKQYLQYLDVRYLSTVENAQGEIIGVGVCITSLSRAIQKAKAKMFPFGWFHLASALWWNKLPWGKRPQVLDMLLVGVLPEYQDKGANALFFADIIPIAIEDGYEWAESHHQLVTNDKSLSMWKHLDAPRHKQRVSFAKAIE